MGLDAGEGEGRGEQHAEVVADVLGGDRFAELRLIGFGLEGSVQRDQEESGGCAGDDEQRDDLLAVAEAVRRADVVMLAAPDTAQRAIYEAEVAPNLKPGALLLFAHGFNIHFGRIVPAAGIDVGMVAPKGPGHLVRSVYVSGGGVPALFAIHQDASGTARARVMAYANGLGCTKAGIMETTFKDETESDLFGEQAVLCGGTAQLVKSAWETLVEAGYDPELAYFETMHELKLIVDLMYEEGIAGMRYSISDTAEYGDVTRGPRVITPTTKKTMQKILKEIQTGVYAQEFLLENQTSATKLNAMRRIGRQHQIEVVGNKLRDMMPWIKRNRLVDQSKN